MHSIWDATLSAYWSVTEVSANVAMFLTLAFALVLGLAVGYERTFHGRAIGMRTYGLVCMSSAALTTFVGYPALWYGGTHGAALASVDPTRVVQGIVTGVGFLGAGVIMKDGLNIRGLTTAASIWSASVIGVLVGVGFYSAAILLSGLSILCMLWIHKLERWLPSHQAISVTVQFKQGAAPHEHEFQQTVRRFGYDMAEGSLSIHAQRGSAEWHFIAVAFDKRLRTSMAELARLIGENENVESFQLSHSRN
jgi:putative Mg2+ transporter-C (MgtC) family protein